MRRGGSYRGKQISTGCAGACLRDGWQAADAMVTGGGTTDQGLVPGHCVAACDASWRGAGAGEVAGCGAGAVHSPLPCMVAIWPLCELFRG